MIVKTIPTGDKDPFKPVMDRATTERCLRYWAKELQLDDWQIEVEYGDKHKTKGSSATVQWSNSLRLAEIRIMTEEVFTSEETWSEYDAEVLLVHELLHIVLWRLIEGEAMQNAEFWCMERSIEILASALVRQRRQLQCNGSL